MGHAVSDHRRALLVCDECGRAMRETQCGSVDDLAAAAMRTGWRVKSVGATGARWVCQLCDEATPKEPRFLDRPTPTS
jgi:Fe2+ or Zn2+ uptake regulation protein